MTIITADRSHAEAWDAYVAASPQASFYHRFGWRQVNDGTLDHRSFPLAALDGGRVVGVLPFVQVKSGLFGNLGCSMPFVNYGGPAARSAAIEQELMAEAARVCEAWQVEFLEIRSTRHLGDALPSSDHKVSMTVTLDANPDVLWTAFKTDHRKDIRKGYKNGLSATFGGADLLDPFYEIMAESWRHLGTPFYRKSYFERIARALGPDLRVCVVSAGDRPAGVALSGVQGRTVEGMWLGTRGEYRNQGVGYVLYWELLKKACEEGQAVYHLGRSTADSGGETFKKKWNATAMPLYWHYLLRTRTELPQLNVNNPKYRLAIEAWRKLPLGVTKVIGPWIARSIP